MKQLDIVLATDIKDAYAGMAIAFVAVVRENGIGLGVAVANEAGYSPVPEMKYLVKTYDEAAEEAERINRDVLMLDDKTANEVVLSSMFKKKRVAA